MRKLIFPMMLICILSTFSGNVFAYFPLPFTYNGHQYSDVLGYSWSADGYDWHQTIYYNLASSGTSIRYQGDNSGIVYIVGAKAALIITQAPQYNGGNPDIQEYWNEEDVVYVTCGVGTTLVPTIETFKLFSSQNILDYSDDNVWFYANVRPAPTDEKDHFTWPVDPQKPSNGHHGWCSDWRKDTAGCYWLNDISIDQANVWRDVQPFQLHYYHYQKIYGYHLGADYNIASGDTDRGQLVHPTSKGEISEVRENVCGWGNLIFVRHDTSFGTYTSMYAHVDWLDSGKPIKGSTVDSKAPIAKVGIGAWDCGKNNKGSYSAHLHFEIREGDNVFPGPAYTSSAINKGPQGQIDPNAFISTHR